jgi:hypothetical protein
LNSFFRRLYALIITLASMSYLAAAQSNPAPSDPPAEPHGKVVFSRSMDDSTQPPAAQQQATVVSTITDADRAAVTFTRYALDVRLRPVDHAIDVRAQLTVRNDGDHPLKQLPLQLSSTLEWQEVRALSPQSLVPAKFAEATIASDVDHTGQLHEAAVELPAPLAPGGSLDLDVFYSGTIAKDAKRLEEIGTPEGVAQSSDWDEVSSAFTGIRGFGNVVWYPVSSVPARLGDGDKLFAEVGAIKQRQQAASVSITVTAETSSDVPDVAILDGTVVPVTVTPGDANVNVPAIVKAQLPATPLRFQTLSLFLANRQKRSGNALDIYYQPADEADVQPYLAAASLVTPLLRTWLQPAGEDRPKALLSILDLANVDDAPFEERQTLFTGLQPVAADKLADPMSHSLTHGYFQSPRPWLNEGVAHFMASLWIEQSHDRETALAQLDDQRSALALAEPGEKASGTTPGLISNPSSIFYRTKATYVLWMLRSLIGDVALQNALKLYDPAKDTRDEYFEQLVERTSAAEPVNKELHQFFEDWVYNDRGLPDLTITGAYPSQANVPGTYLIAVEVENSGGVGADVPVTVSSTNTQVTERLFVPAHGHAIRRLLIQGEPTQVQVDDGIVPETSASVHVQQIHYTAPAKP